MKRTIVRIAAVTGLVGMLFGTAWAAEPHTVGEIVDDTVVTTKIKAQLVADPVTKAHQISVDTFKGTVKLSGFVDSAAAEQRAIEIARNVAGTISIQDDLEIRN